MSCSNCGGSIGCYDTLCKSCFCNKHNIPLPSNKGKRGGVGV